MEVRPLNFSLRMVNLWIGLCKGVPGLPKDLRRLGYDVKGIEYPFANSNSRDVKPELTVVSDDLGHTILLECKSGANTDAEQLQRYADVKANDLTSKAFVSRRGAQSHDTLILGLPEHEMRLTRGISSANCNFPLVIARDDGLELVCNKFRPSELNDKVFSPKLAIPLDCQTLSFVPFDTESDLWVVADNVMPLLLEYMHKRETVVMLDKVCADMFQGLWTAIGGEQQKTLRNKMRSVLILASQKHFGRYLEVQSNSGQRGKTLTWDIRNNPLDLSTDKRRKEFRLLSRLQKQFIDSLRDNKEAKCQRYFDF